MPINPLQQVSRDARLSIEIIAMDWNPDAVSCNLHQRRKHLIQLMLKSNNANPGSADAAPGSGGSRVSLMHSRMNADYETCNGQTCRSGITAKSRCACACDDRMMADCDSEADQVENGRTCSRLFIPPVGVRTRDAPRTDFLATKGRSRDTQRDRTACFLLRHSPLARGADRLGGNVVGLRGAGDANA